MSTSLCHPEYWDQGTSAENTNNSITRQEGTLRPVKHPATSSPGTEEVEMICLLCLSLQTEEPGQPLGNS